MNTINGHDEAEAKVAAAKQDVAAAKQEVAAAKQEVAAAEAKVEAAKTNYYSEKDEAVKPLLLPAIASAQQEVASAQQEVASAQTVLAAVRNLLAALLNPPQPPNFTTGNKRVIAFKDPPNNKRAKFFQCISTGAVSFTTVEQITFSCDLFGESGAGNVLYVRDCYIGLFETIEAKRSKRVVGGAVVTGTPGIGKTMCAAYFIRRYMILNVTVLFKFRNEGYFLFSKTKKWECEAISFELSATLLDGTDSQNYYVGRLDAGDEQGFAEYLKTLNDVVYIVDLNQEKFAESLPAAFTVILTSANKEKYASAVSSATKTVAILWMPVWSLKEIQQHCKPIDRLCERYEVHGGVLRYLLWSEDDAKKDLKAILDTSTSDTFALALDRDCTDARVSGRLVHYKLAADKNYNTSIAVFASKHIRERVAARFFLRERYSFQVTVDKMKFDNSFGSPRGVLSELIWHHQLREGGNFKMKTLTSGGKKVSEQVTDLLVKKFSGDVVSCEHDMRDLLKFSEDAYVSPFGNLPAVDAFMVTKNPFFCTTPSSTDVFLVGFQMAGSKKQDHWLKGPQVANWIAYAKTIHPDISKIVVVLVVSTEDLNRWNMQAFKTKDDKGKWKNYTNLPVNLQKVEQIGLGMPPAKRDTSVV